jgi:predicted SAM-dependent methyltransferase
MAKESALGRIPAPAPMKVNAAWRKRLDLSNFINTYSEYRDLQSFENCREVLIVGAGQGLDREVLRWRGYDVTTFDVDDRLGPDHVGSVHDLTAFPDQRFDAVIASHVLEHLAEPYLDRALEEIARVGKHALVYLPVHGAYARLRLETNYGNIDWSFVVNIFNYFEKPDGVTRRYMSNQHFWEVGMRGYRVKDLRTRMSKFFEILSVYRNRDWLPSQNFVLKSLQCAER